MHAASSTRPAVAAKDDAGRIQRGEEAFKIAQCHAAVAAFEARDCITADTGAAREARLREAG